MFNKSVKKIVATVMAALILFFGAVISIIYFSSSADLERQSKERLDNYVRYYRFEANNGSESGDSDETTSTLSSVFVEEPPAPPEGEERPAPPEGRPQGYDASTFYAVAFSQTGEVLKIDNEKKDVLSEAELVAMATEILNSGKAEGFVGSYRFSVSDKGGYKLVAFIDESLLNANLNTMLKYMLIIGAAGIVVIFFISFFLAKRIVKPLEENDAKQRMFVSDAGHELKTPVAVINANADLLSREIGENKWLNNILYENQKMSALITDLLNLSRAESATALFESIDLSRLVLGEALPFESIAFEKGLTVNEDIDEGICVSGNPTQLKQLTSIFIDNAIRHGDGGEITVRLKAAKKHATLSVENKGKEIPKQIREKLFERFYRADESRTGEIGHYGLGLAIAKAITESHKGKIGINCENGKVIFYSVLPLEE
ncbi:MAG: HAMP domain-containing sensor histidine kinase [Clostridia bacterium]|nr:HAMP domain-containing sensor histidine kinase [Clostridia bacterium]